MSVWQLVAYGAAIVCVGVGLYFWRRMLLERRALQIRQQYRTVTIELFVLATLLVMFSTFLA